MKAYNRTYLPARARVIAFIGLGLIATGPLSCYTGRTNPAALVDQVSRELLPLEAALAYPNLYEAIQQIRPEYLRARAEAPMPSEPVAYLNGVRLADTQMLRIIPVSWAVEVRWVRPNVSSPLYGFRPHLGGGIFVRTK
jgi:hypothetical protein